MKPTLKTVRQDFRVLRSPCGHLANTDTPLVRTAAESPAEITDRWLKQSPGITDSRYYGLTDTSVGPDSTTVSTILYCSNSRYNGHQSAPCDILEEFSQVIIYFFLFFSLKSEHSDSRLTWSFHETTVLTCKKQSWCTKCTEIGFSSALLYGFCDLQIFQWLLRWMKGRCKLCSVTIYRVCK